MPHNYDPAIYHITHVNNLASIVRSQGLWSDAKRRSMGFAITNIAHTHIKARRSARRVPVAARGALGDYVPFNFCPRSVMLYPIHRGHDDYNGGQESIVHLVSSVRTAAALGRPWTFTDRHAELGQALYFEDLNDLDQLDWRSIGAQQWGGPERAPVKECKQAEFLVHESFPWTAVVAIGVASTAVAARVQLTIANASHQPHVQIEQTWYY